MSSSRRKFVQNFSTSLAGTTLSPSLLAKSFSPVIENQNESIEKKVDDMDETNNTSDILVQKLIDWKVEVIFGIIGDGINPIIEALRKQQDKIKLITVSHEEAAAFMASGYAKYTGKLGVCIGTSGPGAVH